MLPNQPTKQQAIRMPLALIERLDAHLLRVKTAAGSQWRYRAVTRSDVVRELLERALDDIESAEQLAALDK